LEAEAAPIRAEGWQWVMVSPSFDYAERQNFKRIQPEAVDLMPEVQAQLDQLQAEYDALIEEHGDEPEQDVLDQLDALSEQMESLTDQAQVWKAEDKTVSGAIIALERDGSVLVERGLIRAEDAKRIFAVLEGGKGREPADRASPLSARLVEDLTAERTAALRAVLMDNQKTALAALAHALALGVFYPYDFEAKSCLDVRLVSRDLETSAVFISKGAAAALLQTRHLQWQTRLPENAADLFGWLLAQDEATLINLITYCTSMSVDAVQAKQDRADCPHLVNADALATSVGLDMAQWWEPTPERYLGRVPKSLILEAVAEGVSKQTAENLVTLKKDALALRAEERLKGKGWLPTILRSPVPALADDDPALMAAE